jgi:hypothetical protein
MRRINLLCKLSSISAVLGFSPSSRVVLEIFGVGRRFEFLVVLLVETWM